MSTLMEYMEYNNGIYVMWNADCKMSLRVISAYLITLNKLFKECPAKSCDFFSQLRK